MPEPKQELPDTLLAAATSCSSAIGRAQGFLQPTFCAACQSPLPSDGDDGAAVTVEYAEQLFNDSDVLVAVRCGQLFAVVDVPLNTKGQADKLAAALGVSLTRKERER